LDRVLQGGDRPSAGGGESRTGFRDRAQTEHRAWTADGDLDEHRHRVCDLRARELFLARDRFRDSQLGVLVQRPEVYGAVYIAWLGMRALQARPPRRDVDGEVAIATAPVPNQQGAFAIGFLTNALNLKATLFFVSLFALVISPDTPKPIQAGYGIWMAVVTAAWFCLVSVFFTRIDVRQRFIRQGHWINRALGVVFIAFAVRLAMTTVME
jgi:arginine exporter protein ArgO